MDIDAGVASAYLPDHDRMAFTDPPEAAPVSDDFSDNWFTPADDAHVRREKARAKELRESQWWKNQLGRGECHYCLARVHPGELTMDHVVPIIRGGTSTRGNVVPCCKACNRQKKHMVPLEWAEYLRKLRTAGRGGGRPGGA